MPQIEFYKPPTNPAKITDSRAKWYIKNWGNHSWEVDALEPKVLHTLINGEIEELMDMELFNDVIEQEKIHKNYLLSIPKNLDNFADMKNQLIRFMNEVGANTPTKKRRQELLALNIDRANFINNLKDKVNE